MATNNMQITINGENYKVNAASVANLIQELRLDVQKVAIEHNLCIVPADEYAETYLADGDVLEIVQFIGGG